MTDYIERLFAHLAWSDAAVLAALEAAPATAERWLELFGHILGAEHVWLSRIRGFAPHVAVWPVLSLADCRRLAEENGKEFTAFVAALPPAERARSVRYINSAGQEFTSTVEDILLHVCLHGSYHRGQLAAAMRAGGSTPAPTDYIGFIRGSPAATRGSGRKA
ncbi:MAG TPA: DinB family protein [Gemmatimonadales bacterium]|nr:DinB family protein [Gemmatimonadales bacterium]